MASQTYRLLILPETLASAAEGQPKEDSFGSNSLLTTDKTLVRIVNNQGVSYSRTGNNTDVFFRIENIPSKIDRADVMIVVLRADKDTPSDYDTLKAGDVIQAYQLRAAFDSNSNAATQMAKWYLNTGTLAEPSRSELFLMANGTSNAAGVSLTSIDNRYKSSEFTNTLFMMGASNDAMMSLNYTRETYAKSQAAAATP